MKVKKIGTLRFQTISDTLTIMNCHYYYHSIARQCNTISNCQKDGLTRNATIGLWLTFLKLVHCPFFKVSYFKNKLVSLATVQNN